LDHWGNDVKLFSIDVPSGEVKPLTAGVPTLKQPMPVACSAPLGAIAAGKVVFEVLPDKKLKPKVIIELLDFGANRVLYHIDCVETVSRLAFSGDGSRLAAAHTDGRISFWKTNANEQAITFKRPADADAQLKFVMYDDLALSPNGQWLAAATMLSRNNLVESIAEIWNTATGMRSVIDKHPNAGLHFLADDRLIVASRGQTSSFEFLAPSDWQTRNSALLPAVKTQ